VADRNNASEAKKKNAVSPNSPHNEQKRRKTQCPCDVHSTFGLFLMLQRSENVLIVIADACREEYMDVAGWSRLEVFG
jgi:hypothetical protein